MPTKKSYSLGNKNAETLVDLVLPSGETCQARRPGVAGLIAAGVLDSFDSLTSLVQTEHIGPKSSKPSKKTPPAAVTEEQALAAGMQMMSDPSKMAAGFQMIDRLVAYVVTQPKVWVDYQLTNESDGDWAKRQEENEDSVGTNAIELEDKLFLMTWAVGDSGDLTTFRQGLSSNVVDLAAMQGVSGSAKRPPRRK